MRSDLKGEIGQGWKPPCPDDDYAADGGKYMDGDADEDVVDDSNEYAGTDKISPTSMWKPQRAPGFETRLLGPTNL